MATIPAASPSRPSTKLMALMLTRTMITVNSTLGQRVEDERAADGQPDDRDALERHDARGEHLPGELGRARRGPTCRRPCPSTTITATPDRSAIGPGCPRLEDRTHQRQLAAEQQRRDDPADHGQPAEARRGLGVHVAVADLGHEAEPECQPADRRGQQVGHRCGDQQAQQVLAHRRVSPAGYAGCFGPGRPPRSAIAGASEPSASRTARPMSEAIWLHVAPRSCPAW